jgi:formate hydrogenlyase transcriptional activator
MHAMATPGKESKSKELLEAQLRATLDVIPAYAWYAAPSGALTFANKRQADYLGLPKDHPLRFGIATGAAWDSHIPFVHPDDHEEARKVWSTCLRTGRAGEFAFRVRNAEGVHRWFITRAEPLRASDGTLLYWIGVNLDIDELKQAQFFLAEGQRLAHMGSWAFNAAGFEYWSSELFRIYGLDPASKPPSIQEYLDCVHPQDRESMAELIKGILEEDLPFDAVKRIVRPDGEVRYIRCVGAPLADDQSVKKYVGSAIDVTEHELLTQDLHRREAYLAEAQRLSHTGSWAWNVRTGALFWSEEIFRIYGYSPQETGPTWEQFLERVHPEDRPQIEQRARMEALEKDWTDSHGDFRIVLPDGTIKHLHSVAHPVTDGSGEITEIIGTVMDVTEHELLTQELRRREGYLAGAQRLSHTGSFGWTPETGEIVWSDETYRIFEYDRSVKPTIDSLVQRVHPEDRAGFKEVINRGLAGAPVFEHAYRMLLPDGRVKHVHAIARVLQDASGNREFVGAATDITERKEAEDKIREQETELRQILDLSPQIIAVYGPNSERLYVNRVALDYVGLSLEEWLQSSDRGAYFHPDDRKRVLASFDRCFSSGSTEEMELRLRKGDGTYRWFFTRCVPLRDEEGQIKRFYAASIDIDDRKRAEERVRQENVALREEVDKASMFEEIVGTSPALKSVLSHISKVAPSDSTVLITGETGTGKELVARAIHRRSNRTSRPFVSVNCAAIPRDLIASELFGHEKGAFTGATQQRLGRFELANGGTIFLDEVGELPSETQIALLRVLQEHEFERIGGSRRIRADVRVIAATNRDLQAAISAGSFRSDLFYRLNVFPIEAPSLQERREDIPLLVEYFIDRYARKAGKNIRGVNKKTLQLLQSYPWPGNIRELQNVIERSVILCETEIFSIDARWLPKQASLTEPNGGSELPRRLLAQEKDMIEAALKESRGRVFGPAGAAAKLGIPRSTLESKIRSLKIDKNRFKTSPEACGL